MTTDLDKRSSQRNEDPRAGDATATAAPAPPTPPPVLVAGPDRSGTTLMFTLLASHPDISMVRRTNMWRYFDRRYGDLDDDENLARCLGDMVRYRRMRHLDPDPERIREEFVNGERSYGRLFSLFHEQHARRRGRSRWGDKSLHTEFYVDRILEDLPDARIVQMVRDPRDRYASVSHRNGVRTSRVGAASARWRMSARAATRGLRRHPGRFLVVRYEDLVRDPEATMRRVCEHIDAPLSDVMFTLDAVPEQTAVGGNSSFGDLEPATISTRAIGRFRERLTPEETAFIQLVLRRELVRFGYEPVTVRLGAIGWLRFALWCVPVQAARMTGWTVTTFLQRRRGIRVPPSKLDDSHRTGSK